MLIQARDLGKTYRMGLAGVEAYATGLALSALSPLRQVPELARLRELDRLHLAPRHDEHERQEEGGEDGHGDHQLQERETAGAPGARRATRDHSVGNPRHGDLIPRSARRRPAPYPRTA